MKIKLSPRHIFIVTLMGFASGLPFALVGSTLQAWYAVDGLSFKTIGLLTLVGQPYLFKFLWAPCLDFAFIKKAGLRKQWIFLTLLAISCILFLFTALTPISAPVLMALLALLLAFCSASLDIAIDAYRVELLTKNERGIGASFSILGYRLATFVSGAFALVLSDYFGFSLTYRLMALMTLIIAFFALWLKEPSGQRQQKSFSFLLPIKALLQKKHLVFMLFFIFFFKLGEAFSTTSSGISLLFLLKGLNLSLTTIGIINKGVGILATIAGSLLAGLMLIRLNLMHGLILFSFLQVMANSLFVLLSVTHWGIAFITFVIFIENFVAGLGTSAILAFMMSLCDKSYSATQFALLSAISALPRILAGPFFGFIQPMTGWLVFYVLALGLSAICIPMAFYLRSALCGTEGGTRTHTMSPSSDFESDASTSSATPAK